MHDHAACSHDAAISDRDARQHQRPAADPHIVADPNRAYGFQAGATHLGIDGMLRRIELHGRADLYIISNGDRSTVKKDAVLIDEDVPAEADVIPVVAREGGKDHGSFADGT